MFGAQKRPPSATLVPIAPLPGDLAAVLAMLGTVLCGPISAAPATAEQSPCWSPAECTRRGLRHLEAKDYGPAVDSFRWACDRRHGEGCQRLAHMIWWGQGVVRDDVEAIRRANQAGDGINLISMIVGSRRGPVLRALRQACDDGDAESCRALGDLYYRGDDVPRDPEEAVRIWRRACAGGDFYACKSGRVSRADQDRFLWQACDRGNASSCNALGDRYRKWGDGYRKGNVSEDLLRGLTATQQAALAYRRACDGGDTRGCGALGELIRQGDVAAAEPEEVSRLLGRACDGGGYDACRYLAARALLLADFEPEKPPRPEGVSGQAEMLLQFVKPYEVGKAHPLAVDARERWAGGDLTPDLEEAARRLRQACDGNHSSACIDAGLLYEMGWGVAQDYGEAARLYRRACDRDGVGCSTFGSADPEPIRRGLLCTYRRNHSCLDLVSSALRQVPVRRNLAETAGALRQACDRGGAHACSYFAFMAWRGQGVEQDEAEAARRLGQACDGGDAYGCRFLGFMAETGTGVAQDYVEAGRLYRKGCRGKGLYGCLNPWGRETRGWRQHLAMAMRRESMVDLDDGAIARLLLQTCRGGDTYSCRYVAGLYSRKALKTDDPVAVSRLYRRACEGGNMIGCEQLADQFWSKQVAPRDDGGQTFLRHLVCDAGFASRCFYLADSYRRGHRVAQDLGEAARLYRLACDGGLANGCWRLGRLTAQGRGVKQDFTEAARLLRQTCDSEGMGCEWLGYLYWSGRGVAQDFTEAARLFRQVCATTLSAYSCDALASFYLQGQGVKRDLTEATRLYLEACESGKDSSCETREALLAEGRAEGAGRP